MRDLGRLLGQMQTPVIVIDSSAAVKLAQNDYGVYSALRQANDDLVSEYTDQPIGSIDMVILESCARELDTMHANAALGDYGIPKTTVVSISAGSEYKTDFPEEFRDRIGEGRSLWRRVSTKAEQGGALSRADEEIISFALEHANNGRRSIVLAYDEDILSPVEVIANQNPNISIARDSLQTPDKIIEINGFNAGPLILMPPKIVGDLFKFESITSVEKYILTARVPIAGTYAEMALSIHPLDSLRGFTSREGDISRYVLMGMNYDETLGLPQFRKSMFYSRYQKSFDGTLEQSIKGSLSIQFLSYVTSQKDGCLWLHQRGGTVDLQGGGINVPAKPREWMMIDDKYLRTFSPQTLTAVQEFKANYTK